MIKVSLSNFKLGAISALIAMLALLAQRHLDIQGDLFTQINISVFIALTIGLIFIFLCRKTTETKHSLRRNAHLLITLNLVIFIILQFSLVNIDRSRSFYVLSWANEGKIYKTDNGFDLVGVISLEALNNHAINARIEEQIQKKFLFDQGDLIRPTRAGSVLIWTANSLSNVFKLENWKINRV